MIKIRQLFINNPSLLIFLFFIFILVTSVYSQQRYDLIENAPQAKWSNDMTGKILLSFGGQATDKRGYVRYLENAMLEDGRSYTRVLQTHPEWENHGIIQGIYDNVVIPANAKFLAKVGFQYGSDQTDGATFKVKIIPFLMGPGVVVASKQCFYDGTLDTIEADLKPFANQTVRIIIQVEAGPSSNKDWAVWAEAYITEAFHETKSSGALEGKKIGPSIKKETKESVTPETKEFLTSPVQFNPVLIKKIPLIPAGITPSAKYEIQEYKEIKLDEPLTISKKIFKDLTRPNTFYYLPQEVNLVRERSTGEYRIAAIWTPQQKIKATLTIKANIDPLDVRIMEDKLKAMEGSIPNLQCLPYEEANIIDMKGWEDWEIEDIRLPTFGSLESEIPICISMSPETLAQLKPLLEKEGLTATMSIKTGGKERAIPIKIGLKYFTGRIYSSVEEVAFSYDENNSIFTIHNVTNFSDFPIKVRTANLRFQFGYAEELYKNLICQPEITILPGETRNIRLSFYLKGRLLTEYRKLFPLPPASQKPNRPILKKIAELVQEELKTEKKTKGEAGKEPLDPKQDLFFKTYLRNYWLEISPDFDCQSCLDKIWEKIEVVSYIERMRKINVELLSSIFDSQSFDPPVVVEKVHFDIRSPYLSAQSKQGLITSVDLNKEKLKDSILVYLPLSNEEQFYFEYKLKVYLKTGELFESAEWEKIVDSLDLTIGPFHIKKLWQK